MIGMCWPNGSGLTSVLAYQLFEARGLLDRLMIRYPASSMVNSGGVTALIRVANPRQVMCAAAASYSQTSVDLLGSRTTSERATACQS